jgi:hypothetical protein
MGRRVKIGSVLLMVVLLSTFAAAIQKPAVQNPELQQVGTTNQLVIGAQDVITASDAGGGYLSSRDLLIITAVCAVVLVVVLVL